MKFKTDPVVRDAAVSILANTPNHFLRSLSPSNARLLKPHLKLLNCPSGASLSQAGQPIESVYFPYSGIVSFTVGFSGGEVVEAGMIGHNGVVGASAALDGGSFTNDATVMVNMVGASVDLGKFKQLLDESDTLRDLLIRHEEMALAQAQQLAACNAVHDLSQRLSRWLLQARDLLDNEILPLTHELLAQILGANRSSVTLVARRLQEAGLVDYYRGKIRIQDLEGLKNVSCECYQTTNAQLHRIIGWSPDRGRCC